jgi:hypothetical protein
VEIKEEGEQAREKEAEDVLKLLSSQSRLEHPWSQPVGRLREYERVRCDESFDVFLLLLLVPNVLGELNLGSSYRREGDNCLQRGRTRRGRVRVELGADVAGRAGERGGEIRAEGLGGRRSDGASGVGLGFRFVELARVDRGGCGWVGGVPFAEGLLDACSRLRPLRERVRAARCGQWERA